MKTMYLLTVILITCCFNLFGQYFVGQDVIEQFKDYSDTSYQITSFSPNDFNNIFLESISKNQYKGNIKISFDKKYYFDSDTLCITIKRSNNKSAIEKEKILISGAPNVWSEKFNIQKTDQNFFALYLLPNEEKKLKVDFKNNEQKVVRLYFTFGNFYTSESRTYIIIYSNNVKPKELRKSTNTTLTPTDFETIADPAVNIPDSGTVQYFNKMIENSNRVFSHKNTNLNLSYVATSDRLFQYANINTTVAFTGRVSFTDYTLYEIGVQNFSLRIYEADDPNSLDNIDENSVYTEYGIATNNGYYTDNITVTKNYFRVGISLKRLEGGHVVYDVGRIEDPDEELVRGYFLLSEVIQNQYSTIDLSYRYNISTDGVLETLRRCAHITNRLDLAISTNVGGDDLSLLQTLIIGTNNDNQVIPENTSFAKNIDETNKINYIRIGSGTYDILDGTIFHEYGHTLAYILTNFDLNVKATGSHYIDQKSSPALAFSEGWGDFWACAVLNDADLYNNLEYNFDLDLSTVDRDYIYSITSTSASIYLPDGITLYDGVENEALAAAALWDLKVSDGLAAVWNGMKSQISNGSSNRAIRNILEYFAANNSLKNSFYNNPTRTEELGFGRSFSFLTKTTNLQNTIPTFSDKTLIYIQDGTYNVSPKIVIDSKSFGIFGMSLEHTILNGQANANTINITNPNTNNDWVKISDIQFRNGGFACDALASGSNQPRLYMSRCYSVSNMRGVCFGGDAIICNNVFANNSACGLFITSRGEDREMYIYNNVIHNCGVGLRFGNLFDVSGYISNNMFSDNFNGIASVDQNALQNDRSDITFSYNGQFPSAIDPSVGLTTSNNHTSDPIPTEYFYENSNSIYKDGGIDISGSYPNEAIFEDLSSNDDYGTKINWVGFYGGRQAYYFGTVVAPNNITIIPVHQLQDKMFGLEL